MDLKKIISQDESEAIEFKKSLSESKEIIKTISAFANTSGSFKEISDTWKSWVIRIKRTAKESFRIYKPDEQNYK